MTTYRGTYNDTAYGNITWWGFAGTFYMETAMQLTFDEVRLVDDDTVSAILSGTGSYAVTIMSGFQSVTSPAEPLTIAPTPITFSLTQPDALLPQFGAEFGYFGSNDIRFGNHLPFMVNGESVHRGGTTIEISGSGDYNWTDGTVYMVGNSRASASLPLVTPLVIVDDINVGVPERQAAEEGISFEVTRLGSGLEPASVAWWVTGDTSWDYTREPAIWEQRFMPLGVDDLPGGVVPSGTVSFAAGERTKIVTVRLADDDAAEWSERLQLNLAEDDSGLFRVKAVGTAFVVDDDPKPTFTLVPRENNPAEGTGGTTTVVFDVVRSGNMAGTVTARWSIAFPIDSPGPFPDASDFAGGVLPSGVLVLPDGQERTPITIELAADSMFERDEALHIELRPLQDSNARYNADWNAHVTIRDDEPMDDLVVMGRDGLARAAVPERYAGPIPGLMKQCVLWNDEDLMLQALGPGWFLRTGAGDDAVVLSGGTNIVDCGTGSNFIMAGGGADTIFVDTRLPGEGSWSTIVGMTLGDWATVWGVSLFGGGIHWLGGMGADGFQGMTAIVEVPGRPVACVTLAGVSQADFDAGRVMQLNSSAGGIPYLQIGLAW